MGEKMGPRGSEGAQEVEGQKGGCSGKSKGVQRKQCWETEGLGLDGRRLLHCQPARMI